MTSGEAEELLESKRMKFDEPVNSEEFVLSRVGKELYEAFYLGYTLKQWDIHPKDLAPSVCGRIPVRLNTDERYVDHQYQVTPAAGFTAMFGNMISHPNIDVLLGKGNAVDFIAALIRKHNFFSVVVKRKIAMKH